MESATAAPKGYRFRKSGTASPILLPRSESLPLLTSATPRHYSNDPKLHQIVRRIIASTPSLLIVPNSKTSAAARRSALHATFDLVLEKHREYRRKDREAVLRGVEGVLDDLVVESGGGCGSGSTGGKKRVVAGGGSRDSEGDAKRAKKEFLFVRSTSLDAEVVDGRPGGSGLFQLHNHFHSDDFNSDESNKTGGMLNASLRNRYKEQREQRGTGVTSDCPQSLSAVDVHGIASTEEAPKNDEVGPKEKDDAASNPTTPKPLLTSTPKKKKPKKTPSKSPSNKNHNHNNDSPITSSSPLLLPSPRPTERYSTLGGISSLLTTIRQLVEYPLTHPELFTHLGIEPPRGVLLRGPPGCGKTHLARAIAGELNASYFQVGAPELVGGVSGESESRVRALFESAALHAPSVVFIDEIDAIAPKRGDSGGGKSMEKRIVAQLLTSMDGLALEKTGGAAVIVLGATNRPDALDSALRRAGRFDREIVLGAPDEAAREGILRVMTSKMRLDGELDYRLLAKKTPGFVGADVRSLTKEAAVIAINRIFRLLDDDTGCGGDDDGKVNKSEGDFAKAIDSNKDTDESDCKDKARSTCSLSTSHDDSSSNDIRTITSLTSEQLSPLYITMNDFLSAIPNVQPSAKREGFATAPDVSWSDIGALSDIREELTLSVLEPIAHPERFEALGLPLPAGVLLYGPPGCGKTLLAKAIANESGANFISVKGPELLDKYVGESERSVRVVFERARSSSPCIIFFDELDSLCPKRGSDGGGGGGVSERVVNQLLTEMDGLDSRRSVFVIAATNRPELIDPAMLRPGRLDKLLYVSLPTPNDRLSILRALSKKVNLAPDVNLESIAHDPHANGFSGADCAALLREAGLAVLRDGILNRSSTENIDAADSPSPLQITAHHFKYAFDHVLPSVSKKDQARYDRLRERMARARTRGGGESNVANGEEDGGGNVEDVPPESNAV